MLISKASFIILSDILSKDLLRDVSPVAESYKQTMNDHKGSLEELCGQEFENGMNNHNT